MRIRKSASKLLGVILPEYISSCSPPLTVQEEEEEARNSQIWYPELNGSSQVCELNQSPWDVGAELFVSLPQIYFSISNDSQSSTSMEEKGLVLVEDYQNKFGENGSNSTTATVMASNDVALEKNDEKINGSSSVVESGRKKCPRKKTHSNFAATAMEDATCSPLVCRKSDGKKWKCKRLVSNHQHSFCDYHLDQVRHYHSNKNCNISDQIVNTKPVVQELPPPQKINKLKKREIRNKVKETGTGSGSSFYYYAGFGPWSTKTRRMTNGTTGETAKQETTEHDKGNSVESSDDGADQEHLDTQQKQAAEGKLSELEQNDGDDHEEQHESDSEIGIVLPCNKTSKGRRRRIKARSLKSLL